MLGIQTEPRESSDEQHEGPQRIEGSESSKPKPTTDNTFLDLIRQQQPEQSLQELADPETAALEAQNRRVREELERQARYEQLEQKQQHGPETQDPYEEGARIKYDSAQSAMGARVREEIMGELENMKEDETIEINNQTLELKELKKLIEDRIKEADIDSNQIADLSEKYKTEIDAFEEKYKETLESRELKVKPDEDVIDKMGSSLKILVRISLIAGTAYYSGGSPLVLAGSAAFLAKDIFMLLNDPNRQITAHRKQMIEGLKETLNSEEQRLRKILESYTESGSETLEDIADGRTPLTREEIEHGLQAIKTFNEQFERISEQARMQGAKT